MLSHLIMRSCLEWQIVTVTLLWTVGRGQLFTRKYTKSSTNCMSISDNHLTWRKDWVQLVWKHKLYLLLSIFKTKQFLSSVVSSVQYCVYFVFDVEKITMLFHPKIYILDCRPFSDWLQSLCMTLLTKHTHLAKSLHAVIVKLTGVSKKRLESALEW